MELFDWILLGLAGWGLAMSLVLILMQMAGDQEGAARRLETRTRHESGTPAAKPGPQREAGDRDRVSTEGPDRG